jgi:hypothetical protein
LRRTLLLFQEEREPSSRQNCPRIIMNSQIDDLPFIIQPCSASFCDAPGSSQSKHYTMPHFHSTH